MKTTKLFTGIILFLMVVTTADAQVRFGLRGEVGLNKPSFSEKVVEVENLTGFKLGPTAEFTIPLVGLAIEGSLMYGNDKMNVRGLTEEGVQSTVQKISNHYLDVPVYLKYKKGFMLPIKVYMAAGPYGRFLLSGDDVKISDATKNIKAKNFEAGINLGAGVELFSRLAVGINYGFILTDNYGTDKPEWKDALNGKDGNWALTATVFF
ncbi:porin family protein [Proteiniphilum sp. UBA5384]|uniref:porin family protein n=1 Tax=Proteiniphilum sp. UBA5384 TaxID=1947279 RepID=UPI0025CDD9C7|nr:porin family protein [Proteiniphilum sp. UBA5384]